jgi:tetratricopeptide (TPR) repeat protein
VQGKAATLHQMAIIYVHQGQVERALSLYQQSLGLYESIGDVQGKAATLHQMAGICAQQGQVERALSLYQQVSEIDKSIGDVQGKAATLHQMAYLAGQQGDRERATQLYLQVAATLGQIRAYPNLVTVLGNLGSTPGEHQLVYLAQALWLALRVQVSFTERMNRIHSLFQAIPQADPLEPLLARVAVLLCESQTDEAPDLEQWRERSINMPLYAARNQNANIETSEQLQAWMTQAQLTDPEVFLPRLFSQLETRVGDRWLFDRAMLN